MAHNAQKITTALEVKEKSEDKLFSRSIMNNEDSGMSRRTQKL